MSIGLAGILDAVISHAQTSGHFDTVNGHELKSAPGPGLHGEVWVSAVSPVRRRSGMAATSARVQLTVRVTTTMLSEPQDAIEPLVVDAVDALMTAYSGDFQLGGLVSEVDLLGAYGDPLQARGGYLTRDRTMYRALDITLPVILNDVWSQSA